MRFDSVGMFWADAVKEKAPKKEKPVKIPPKPVWLEPGYLPNLERAKALTIDQYDPVSLTRASVEREPVVFDVESYPNYFLCSFKGLRSGKVAVFQRSKQFGMDFDNKALYWMLTNLLIVGFNSKNYDETVSLLAAAGNDEAALYQVTQALIVYGERPHEILKSWKVRKPELDHIDLIELTALRPSLKKIAAALFSPIMQDLPFPPGTMLSYEQMLIIRWYNIVADLGNTIRLYNDCTEELELRHELGAMYGIDLRSKSDAQISETVISHEVKQRLGLHKLKRPGANPGHTFRFEMPAWLTCQSKTMWEVHEAVRCADFVVNEAGYIELPKELEREINIAGTIYHMGIGGLHSKDKKLRYTANERFSLRDIDVRSYYPKMIINSGKYPIACGTEFIPVYANLTDRRLTLKDQGFVKKSNGMKIVVNGGFGKTGSPYSILYGPELLIQTTVGGQLALLMLIESLEMHRIHIVSANTDGIVIWCERSREEECNQIVKAWEKQTGLETEETRYQGLYMRDVNNYVAIYETAQKGLWYKGKGIFTNEERKKVPINRICIEAAVKFMVDKTPIEKTVRECRDFTRFLAMAYSKDGIAKGEEYLGKVGRWYMPIEKEGELQNVRNGHTIPKSTGGKPCMILPETFPDDVDFDWYIEGAYDLLYKVQYLEKEKKK